MSDKAPTLQDIFLNGCRRNRVPVTMFLVKGIKLGGVISGFDAFSLMLRRDGQSQLVYKHGISTIAPLQPVDLALGDPAAPAKPGLQEQLLSAAKGEGGAVTLYLVNGVMLQGRLEAYDQFAVLLGRGGQQQLVYKHAISTLTADVDLRGPEGVA